MTHKAVKKKGQTFVWMLIKANIPTISPFYFVLALVNWTWKAKFSHFIVSLSEKHFHTLNWNSTSIFFNILVNEYQIFSNFSWMFLKPNNFYFFLIWIMIVLKPPGTSSKSILLPKNCSDLSLFEQIVLVILKILRSASNLKSFSRSLEQFFLTVGHNNFGNKIPNLQNTISFAEAQRRITHCQNIIDYSRSIYDLLDAISCYQSTNESSIDKCYR